MRQLFLSLICCFISISFHVLCGGRAGVKASHPTDTDRPSSPVVRSRAAIAAGADNGIIVERKRYVCARRRRGARRRSASPTNRGSRLAVPSPLLPPLSPGPPNTVSRRNILIEQTSFVFSIQLSILLTWFLFKEETIDEFQTYLSSFSRFWTPRKCKRESGPHPRAKRAHEIRLRASAPPAPLRASDWTCRGERRRRRGK